MLYFLVFIYNAVWALTSGGFRIVSETLVWCAMCMFTEAVHMNLLASKASDYEMEQQIKEWLKFTEERAGRRREQDANKYNGGWRPLKVQTTTLISRL